MAELASGRWSALPRAPIPPRAGASVVWTGRELLVWGGQSGSDGDELHGDGAAYNPRTGRWRVLPPTPLSPRVGQAAAWAGTEMIVWGGYDRVSPNRLHVSDDGAAYDPTADRWRMVSRAPLSPRTYAIAVWTGKRLILLGGRPAVITDTVRSYGDGAAYDPAGDRWQPIAPPTPPSGHPLAWRTAVQARDEVLAWSEWATYRQVGPNSVTESGGVDLFGYDENTGWWRFVPAEPSALPDAEEVLWTGRSAVVRGITYNCGGCAGPFVPEATEFYDPARNTWTRIPADPLGGDHLVSAWTGDALFSFDAEGVFGPVRPGDATAYDPAARRWRRLPAAPFGCDTDLSPVWTGRQVLMYCPRPRAGAGAGNDGLAFSVGPRKGL